MRLQERRIGGGPGQPAVPRSASTLSRRSQSEGAKNSLLLPPYFRSGASFSTELPSEKVVTPVHNGCS